MPKWADYGISSVRYDAKHMHIDRVRIHKDEGERLGQPTDAQRASVVAQIKQGTTFVTMTKDGDGKWLKGQPVHVVEINGADYIKTSNNNKEGDNLENLPEY